MFVAAPVFSQEESDALAPSVEERYYRGTVVEVVNEGTTEIAGYTNFFQILGIEIAEGARAGDVVEVEHGGVVNITPEQLFALDDEVVLIGFLRDGEETFSILDRYRARTVLYIVAAFFVLVVVVAGWRGLGSIVGLGTSFTVIVLFIVPQIINGRDPVLISIIGSVVIMVATMYLAHSKSLKTTIAVGSTFLTLVLAGAFSYLTVELAHLSGVGSEESFLLQFQPTELNLKGLLLGGMIIGALGVLDDVTTTQVSTIFELKKANSKLGFSELLRRGLVVGRDHVAALVNTLVLAYAGVSLGLFILFVMNPADQPYWVIFNSEIISEEVVRTVSGSTALVLAVPITTAIASWIATRRA